MDEIYEAFLRGTGNPDLVSPDKAERIEQGLGYEPILPGGSETTHEIASVAYQRAMDILRRYVPAEQIPMGHGRQFSGLLMGMMKTLGKIKPIENTRREYLEMLAVDTVLNLPEFSSAKDAVDRGDLIIEATLLDGMIQPQDEEAEQEMEQEFSELEQEPSFNKEIELALVDIEQEKYKRRMQNIMAQGAASNYMYLFELTRNEINAINPRLADMYGFMQSVGDMAMWALPEEMGQGRMKAGEEKVTQDNDVGVIKARAIIYPLLIHEIVKGIIVYINSHGLSPHEEVRAEIQDEIDTPENEIYDLMLGSVYWKKLKDAVGEENSSLLMHVWGKITSLPAWDSDIKGSFGHFMKEFLKDPDTAKRIIRPFISEIQNAIDIYEEENRESDAPTFEAFSYNTLMEALTNQMKMLLQKYNADIQNIDPQKQQTSGTGSIEKPMTEAEMEEWASVDPSGVKGVNLPIMMTLKKAKLIKKPKDILNIINNTTYVPLKKNEKGKLPPEIPYPQAQIDEFIKRNANTSLPWVLKQIKDRTVIYPEDLPSVKDTLHFFFKYKDTKYWPESAPKDLTKYPKITNLFDIVFQIKRDLFASQMSGRIKTVYPDTRIIGVYPDYEDAKEHNSPLYELVQIYPTPQGQESLYNYVNETGSALARWCTAYKAPAGWNHFSRYLKLKDIPGEDNIHELSDNAKHDPVNSHYYVAKDGAPYMLFEFKSNYCMDKGDNPFPNNKEFQQILKPLILRYIPISRGILASDSNKSSPSKLFLDYVKNNPHKIANAIICRLKVESEVRGFNPFENLTNDTEIKRCVSDLLEELTKRLQYILKQKDQTWSDSLSSWKKYNVNNINAVSATPISDEIKHILDVPEVFRELFKGFKNIDNITCKDVSLSRRFTDDIIDLSIKANETSLEEGVISNALGTAALITSLGTHSLEAKENSRGMRNNNPGNIVQNERTWWEGSTGHDGRFVKFKSMEYGIRAMARTLRVYHNKHGLKTIKDIVHRWAPAKENSTDVYINFVCKETGLTKNQVLNLNSDEQLARIINAMIKFENSNSVPMQTIYKGIEMSK